MAGYNVPNFASLMVKPGQIVTKVELFMSDDVAQPRGKKAGRGRPSGNSNMEHADITKKNPTARLDGEAQAQIGEKLKAMYNDVVSQPIPDRFRDLLDQLDKRRLSGKDGEYLN